MKFDWWSINNHEIKICTESPILGAVPGDFGLLKASGFIFDFRVGDLPWKCIKIDNLVQFFPTELYQSKKNICTHINELKRFNQLSLSRNSFLISIVFLLTFSWNIWRLYKLRHEVADGDVPEWTVDQFDYHFHAFLRIFFSKMKFSLKFGMKMIASGTDLKWQLRK